MAEACRSDQTQHRSGGRFLEPDRAAGREVRLQRPGRLDPGRAEPQHASRAVVVRNLEERSLQLPARLGEEEFRALPTLQMVGDNTPWPVFGTTRSPVTGPLNIELLSPFGDAARDADARALAALMRHIKGVDGREHTVIMIQVENETDFRATPATARPWPIRLSRDRSRRS